MTRKTKLLLAAVAVAALTPTFASAIPEKGHGPSSNALICKFIPDVCRIKR